MKRVCVFAGSSSGARPEYQRLATQLGSVLAARRVGLVYGGAHVGLMGALADAALAGGGEVIGVIPEGLVAKEIAHTGLTSLRVVSSMHERKAMMADLADAFIAMPGGLGTWEEFFEILTWSQLGLHRKPCGLLNALGYFDGLVSFIIHAVNEGFVRPQHAALLVVSSSPGQLLEMLETHNPPVVDKWVDRAAT
jgi:hypothetical protein